MASSFLSLHLAVLALASALAAAPAGAQSLGCLITPSNVVELGSPTIGVIQKVLIDRGDVVKEGQVLAVLRGDVERANVDLASSRANAEAELQAAVRAHDLAQRKLERTQDLFRKEFVSAQAVDQALAEVQAAQARKDQAVEQSAHARKELAVAAAQLDNRTLRSPIDGVVLDLYRRKGERVEDRPILKIATLDPLYVEVVLPSSMYGRVKPGAHLTVRPEMAGLPPLSGTVQTADRVIDPASNTFRVRAVLPNPDAAIPAGLRCQAQLPDAEAMAASPALGATAAVNAPVGIPAGDRRVAR